MRFFASIAIVLASTVALASAAASSSFYLSSQLVGTEQVDFVATVTGNTLTPFETNEILMASVPSMPWDNANSGTNDITCKGSQQTRIFDAPDSLFFDADTYVSTNAPTGGVGVQFGIKLTAVVPTVGSTVHLVCRVNLPTEAVAALATATVKFGTEGSWDFELPATLPAVQTSTTLSARPEVALRVSGKTAFGMTHKIHNGVRFHYLALQDAASATKSMVAAAALFNVVYTPNEAVPAESTLAFTIRLTPSLDSTAASVIAAAVTGLVAELATLDLNAAVVTSVAASVDVAGHCFNLQKDSTETAIDLGGNDCDGADLCDACNNDADCWSGVCKHSKCANAASALAAPGLAIALLALLAAAFF